MLKYLRLVVKRFVWNNYVRSELLRLKNRNECIYNSYVYESWNYERAQMCIMYLQSNPFRVIWIYLRQSWQFNFEYGINVK